MRVPVEFRTTSRETFKRFQDENPSVSINYTEWCNIIYTFNYNFRDYILETGDKARLPWGMGEFAISKKKAVREVTIPSGETKITLHVDWVKSRKHGKRIYHLNAHTEGFNFKWKYFTKIAKFPKSDVWVFKPSRVSSRLLKHYLSQPEYQYKYKEWHLAPPRLKRKRRHAQSPT